ncbi:MAG: amidohydrolase [Firmicutes bacterium HGW-Firmicutes-19]|jgi:amidohydrolase|nr:MAG: amidohydrolase [Firmicutes bacterium HGW-Firmicutes-19]
MEEQLAWVTSTRRMLHQIPELGFNLFKTSLSVKEIMESLGYQVESVASTGWIAFKQGELNEAIAFRADMDALPVSETTNVDFASTHPGNMHACGHDGHMTMLLGFAKRLAQKSLKYSVVFIFQPAEEGPGGAKIIVDSGLFGRYDIQAIFGIHLYPGLPEGIFGLCEGPMMAQNGEFDIVIQGVSSHGAQPHLGSDAILAQASLIQGIHSIVSRNLNPLDSAVITVGTIRGGEARNIIAQSVSLSGTIRAFNEDVYKILKQRVHAIGKGCEAAYGVSIQTSIKDYYPPVINDRKLVQLASSILDEQQYRQIQPLMISEDFSFYQQVVRGCFVLLGTGNDEKGYIHPLHSSNFNFDESVLLNGIDFFEKILINFGE